ncbi:hypothetical protein QTP86_016837, partial [Hemibagrus guttatus]
EEYMTSVTSYFGKCIDDMTISKTITTRSNQKSWMTAEVHALLKSGDSAFRAGDFPEPSSAQRSHGHFQDSRDSRCMWQGIQAITNYKTTSPACDSDASLPDALNDVYAQFEAQNSGTSVSPDREQHLQHHHTPTRPLLFTLLTHDCAAIYSLNHIIRFANDMTVVGLISKNDESAYREEVQQLTAWCKANNLSLNVEKTKDMVVDSRRAQSGHSPLFIDGSSVEEDSLVYIWQKTSPGHSTPAPSARKPSSISTSCRG